MFWATACVLARAVRRRICSASKSIERAKGLLMEKDGLTEQQAFARLRKASQVSGRPLRVIADAVIATFVDAG